MNTIGVINQVEVTTTELIAAFSKAEEFVSDDSRDPHPGIAAVAALHFGNWTKAAAILFRIAALVRLVEESGAPGWALRATNGEILASEPLLAAAAIEPLVERDDRVIFETESFLRRVLELAESAGTA